MVKLYGLCLSIAYIAHLAPSLHRESTDSLIVMAPNFFHCPKTVTVVTIVTVVNSVTVTGVTGVTVVTW